MFLAMRSYGFKNFCGHSTMGDHQNPELREVVQRSLEDDAITPPGQTYVLISIVGPEEPQKCDQFLIKVRGVFATRAEADAHVRKLQKWNNDVHIYVGDVGKWLPLPPKADKIEDQRYQEQFLDDMMTSYQENQLEAKRMFEERKRAVMKEGVDKHLSPEEKLPKPSAEQLLATMRSQSAAPNNDEASGSGSASKA